MRNIFCKIIRRIYLGRLMSLRAAMFWHKFGRIITRAESPLLPDTDDFNFSTSNINDEKIRKALSSVKLTRWSLDVDSINWLIKFVGLKKHDRVLEFGSGTSSILFANICGGNGEEHNPVIVSLEQDKDYAEQSRDMIKADGFEDNVTVIHCPLGEREHELGEITGYNVTDKTFSELPQGWKSDILFVDGPATDGWGRLPAIADCADYLSDECILIMDDALRDDELKIVSYLAEQGDWKFDGIAPVSKGIAVARRK